jgi:excisionase family DNA binding protein
MVRRERYLRTSEVAVRLQVSPKTVARWAKEGRLPYQATLGGHRRFPASAVDQMVDDLSQIHDLLGGLAVPSRFVPGATIDRGRTAV